MDNKIVLEAIHLANDIELDLNIKNSLINMFLEDYDCSRIYSERVLE